MNKESIYISGVFHALGLNLAGRAIYYVAEAHKGQKRDDGKTDCSEHPTRVCRMLLNLGIKDEITLATAFLHDTVEDGNVTPDDIREEFGGEVAYLVGLLTKEGSAEEHFKKVSRDIRTIVIKAVDRVCNVDDMAEVFTLQRLINYINETEKYVIPMMKAARRKYLDYSDILIICRDYIKGILRAAGKIVVIEREKTKLTRELARLKRKQRDGG